MPNGKKCPMEKMHDNQSFNIRYQSLVQINFLDEYLCKCNILGLKSSMKKKSNISKTEQIIRKSLFIKIHIITLRTHHCLYLQINIAKTFMKRVKSYKTFEQNEQNMLSIYLYIKQVILLSNHITVKWHNLFLELNKLSVPKRIKKQFLQLLVGPSFSS